MIITSPNANLTYLIDIARVANKTLSNQWKHGHSMSSKNMGHGLGSEGARGKGGGQDLVGKLRAWSEQVWRQEQQVGVGRGSGGWWSVEPG